MENGNILLTSVAYEELKRQLTRDIKKEIAQEDAKKFNALYHGKLAAAREKYFSIDNMTHPIRGRTCLIESALSDSCNVWRVWELLRTAVIHATGARMMRDLTPEQDELAADLVESFCETLLKHRKDNPT